jgi:hypothetical protein
MINIREVLTKPSHFERLGGDAHIKRLGLDKRALNNVRHYRNQKGICEGRLEAPVVKYLRTDYSN